MKRILTLVIVMLMLCSMAFGASALEWKTDGTIFPLAEPKTFTILTAGFRNADIRRINENEDWQSLLKAANIQIDFVYLGDYDAPETRDNLQMRLLSGEYCDAIWGFYVDTLTVADINDLAAADILIPLDDFLTNPEIMSNLYKNVVSVRPGYMSNLKSEDGHVYQFAGISETVAYTSGEAQMMVNTEWLESWKTARGVDHSPLTLAEFEDMLVYFRDADLNGNGAKDEIPYFIAQNGFRGCCTLEHAMGMYGVATKDSTADMDIMIGDDGKAFYAYTTDMYKAGLTQFAQWYKDGLVWQEAVTGNADTINDVMGRAASSLGVYNACEDMPGFSPLMPPEIDGYSARYHRHPSIRTAVRQPLCVITNKCENPEILASFLDLVLDFDNWYHWMYGSANFDLGAIIVNDEGKYEIVNLAEKGVTVPENYWSIKNYPIDYFLYRMDINTLDLFNARVDEVSYFGKSERVKGSRMYMDAGIWNPIENLWPRCPLLAADADDYAFMYTDVATTVAEFRAKCLTGEWDINEKWDGFQAQLKTLGIDKMLESIQRAYDAYLSR